MEYKVTRYENTIKPENLEELTLVYKVLGDFSVHSRAQMLCQ